jgi:hypothetical protein
MQSQDLRGLSEGAETRGIYRVGGACAAITGIAFFSALVSIVAYSTNPPTLMSQELPYISSHSMLWELAYGSLLMAVVFSLPAIVALYYSLRISSRTFATVGSLISIAAVPIFTVGVVNMLSVVSLGKSYESASGSVQSAYLAASSANIGSGLLLQEVALLIVGAGAILLSLALFKGVLGKGLGTIGLVTGALVFPSVLSSPILAVDTILFGTWFILISWKTIQNLERRHVRIE